jgi:hypothetical protein
MAANQRELHQHNTDVAVTPFLAVKALTETCFGSVTQKNIIKIILI